MSSFPVNLNLTDMVDTSGKLTARARHDAERVMALAAEEEPPPPWPNLVEALDITLIDDYALDAAEAADIEQLAHALVDLDTIRLRIALAIQVVEDALVPLMATKTLEVTGLPVLEQRGGTERKAWQTEQLAEHVVTTALNAAKVTPDTPVPTAVAAAVGALTSAAPFTPSMKWRAGALRKLGIEPDDWCETSRSRRTIEIHRSAAQAVTA